MLNIIIVTSSCTHITSPLYVTVELETTDVVNSENREEEKIVDILKVLLRGSSHFFLRNKMAKHIIEMNFYELKVQFSEILCILRYLMALDEHLDASVITEKCQDELRCLLKLLCDYSMWMICRGVLLTHTHTHTCTVHMHAHACTHTHVRTHTYMTLGRLLCGQEKPLQVKSH